MSEKKLSQEFFDDFKAMYGLDISQYIKEEYRQLEEPEETDHFDEELFKI